MKKAATDEGYFDDIEEQYNMLKEAMQHSKEEDLATNEKEIREMLKLEIVSRYYFQEGKIRASLSGDPEISNAIQILEDPVTYESILDGSYTGDKAESEDKKEKDQG